MSRTIQMAFIDTAATTLRRPRNLTRSTQPALPPRRLCSHTARTTRCGPGAEQHVEDDDNSHHFRPHGLRVNDEGDAELQTGQMADCLPVELVDGYLDNAKVRPKIDIDADEYMLMWKLRKMLHEDDFNRIFDPRSHKIGDF